MHEQIRLNKIYYLYAYLYACKNIKKIISFKLNILNQISLASQHTKLFFAC